MRGNTMALQLNTSRSLISKKLAGAFFAIFALFIQPLVALDVPSAFAAPVINEVMPHTTVINDADGEWVEIHNQGNEPQDISGWKLDGYTFADATVLSPDQHFVVCRETSAAAEVDCDVENAAMVLNNDGDTVMLYDSNSVSVDSFTYEANDVNEGQSIEVVVEDGTQTPASNTTDTYGTSGNTGTPGAQNRNQPVVVDISSIAELRNAIKNQTEGQTWNIAPGSYGLAPFNDMTVSGQTGWYFPIMVDNLTINGAGEGATTLYGAGYSPNGNWATQNLVSVFGNKVTINGMTFMPKVQPNKTIEVLGADFTLSNVTIAPNTLSPADYSSVDPEYQQWGGSLYFSHAGNHVVENVTIKNAGISYRYAPSGTNLTFTSVTLDYASDVDWINSYRYSTGFNNSNNPPVGDIKVVYHVSDDLDNLNSVMNAVKDGDVIEVDSDLALSQQLTITKDVTINGNGNTITGEFTKTSNSNNSVIGVQSNGVTISNLAVDAGDVSKQLHGINVYESDDVTLTDVVALNGRSGVVVGQGSIVTIEDITTDGNAWHGINVDKDDAHLTISGNNSHDSAKPAMFVDDKTVIDGVEYDEDQYSLFENGNTQAYVLTSTLSNESGDTVLPAVGGVAKTPTNHTLELQLGDTDTTVIIPTDTEITAHGANASSWDGTITAPTASPYVVPGSFETGLALMVGSNEYTLTFEDPVKIVLAGQAGKRVGFVPAGSSNLTEITTVCEADVATQLESGYGDCKMDDGDHLVVWTKHFTTFVTYNKAETGNNGSDGEPTSGDIESTPGTVSPLATQAVLTFAAQEAADNSASDDGEVLGTGTEDAESLADKVAAIAPSEDGWKLWGIAWYWYLLALGALGFGGWYAARWYQNRQDDF